MSSEAIDITEQYMQNFSFGKEESKSIKFWKKYGVGLTNLKKIKYLKTRSFMSFDTETKDGLKGSQMFCFSISYFKRGFGNIPFHYNRIVKNNYDLDDLFDIIRSNDKTHKRIVFCHNLGFDERFIREYCRVKKIECIPLQSGSSVINLSIPSLNVIFRDSYQFLQSSQEEAEKEYILSKNEEDYKKYSKIDCSDLFKKDYKKWSENDKIRVLKHNGNDTDALLYIMNEFRQLFFDIAQIDVLTQYSLASLAMKIFRTTICRDKPIENPFVYMKWNEETNRPRYYYDKERENFVRSSYFGGRTEVFNQNEVKNAKYIDRVSMYPSEMYFRYFPIGIPIWVNCNDGLLKKNKSRLMNLITELPKLVVEQIPETIEEMYKNDKNFQKLFEGMNINPQHIFGKEIVREKYSYEGFIQAKIKPSKLKFPILPERLDNKLMFTNCERIGIYTLPELRYAYQMGYEIEPVRGFIFKDSALIFSEFIAKLFLIKSTNEGGKKKCAKIGMNASYGKFGQAFERDSLMAKFFDNEEDQLEYYYEQTKNLTQKQIDRNFQLVHDINTNFYVVNERIDSISVKPFMNVAISSYITAYSRLALTKQLHYLEDNNIEVFYSDTDSITVEDKNLDKIKLSKMIGGWDIEESFEKVKFLAPKGYFGFKYNKKKKKVLPFIKLKGLDKEGMERIVKLAIKKKFGMKEIENELRKEIKLIDKYMSYRESLRHGIIVSYRTKRTKHYSFENAKRNFMNGFSEAWNDLTLPEKFKVKCSI